MPVERDGLRSTISRRDSSELRFSLSRGNPNIIASADGQRIERNNRYSAGHSCRYDRVRLLSRTAAVFQQELLTVRKVAIDNRHIDGISADVEIVARCERSENYGSSGECPGCILASVAGEIESARAPHDDRCIRRACCREC